MKALSRRLLTILTALCFLSCMGASLSFHAAADDVVITKVLTTLSSTPVALVDPSLITAATSTDGCYIISATWYDANGNAATGAFNAETYRLELRVGAMTGFAIDPSAACYLNNSAITASVDGDGKAVTLSREYTAAIWAPTIYKHPGDETINEGSWASFVVSGAYIRDYKWELVNPTGTSSFYISDLATRFPKMSAAGDGSAKLMLYNVPYELNGWKVVCNFIGAGDGNTKESQAATLTVIPDPSRATASPSPSVSPSPSPSPEASPIPSAVPAATPKPTPHVHFFSSDWKYDSTSHWHECPDDATRADEAEHSITWTVIKESNLLEEGEERGTCKICGYTETRTIEKASLPSVDFSSVEKPSTLMMVLLGIAVADAVFLILHLAVFGKQRKRAQRKRRKK
ncbi:MAG: hypothetical protein K6C08_07815 [Oscillospiraceae bacterium]|nr:hypothetical protein [Oscillospiraceae bacterium]